MSLDVLPTGTRFKVGKIQDAAGILVDKEKLKPVKYDRYVSNLPILLKFGLRTEKDDIVQIPISIEGHDIRTINVKLRYSGEVNWFETVFKEPIYLMRYLILIILAMVIFWVIKLFS